ncbi:outer membrane beta-barrel protein [Spiribacter roseus]|uniref:outer membrane beta-barrel protein n=1 Tax=Spiribacter roseus TaxID=1855875 RepID=UPI0013305220|nr:outer membrane beta-barrel protein [Spiribacter roseus]KAF0283471.1 hypothetical protein BA898_02785 [Spiribacter roseus]
MKRSHTPSALVLAAALGTIAGTANAVDPMPVNQDGPVDFIPTLKVSQGYDDNVSETKDGESSNVTKVAPTFLLRAQERANRYQFRYTPTFERYSHDSDNNRVNHFATATSRLILDARNRVNLGLSARRNQQTIGESETETSTLDEGDINERLTLDGTYTFGARGAKGQIELDGGYLWNRYANNKPDTNSEEYDSPRAGATFLWRVAPRTQLLIEGRYADFDYVNGDPGNRDSKNLSALVGARWQATAKTSGSVRVGREDKDFDAAGKDDTDANRWEAQVNWRPAAHSRVRLNTGNSIKEASSDDENAIEQTTYGLSWDYDWDGQVSSNVAYRFRDKDYVGPNTDRNDELHTVSVGVSYSFRRWLDFGFETRFKDNDSNDDPQDYDQNTYFLTATLSL